MRQQIHVCYESDDEKMTDEKVNQFIIQKRNEITDHHVDRKKKSIGNTYVKIYRGNICIVDEITKNRTDHKSSDTVQYRQPAKIIFLFIVRFKLIFGKPGAINYFCFSVH